MENPLRAALAIPSVTVDREENLSRIRSMTERASREAMEIIVFPEAALTGLLNCDVPEKDFPLCVSIPGEITEIIAACARNNRIFLGMGMLEQDGGKIFDSAVSFSPNGKIIMKYRRMQPQWHGRKADPSIYCQGTGVEKVDTDLGSFTFLICGDIFDDRVISLAKSECPDYVLMPMARCFDDGSYDQGRWDREEKKLYAKRIKRLGIKTLITNSLADVSLNGGSFGGAFVFDESGDEVGSYPLGKAGLFFVDV